MKRLIAVVVAAVLGVVLFSPPSFAVPFDPAYPPIPVDRQPYLDRPSADDKPWDDFESYRHDSDTGLRLVVSWTDILIQFVGSFHLNTPDAENLCSGIKHPHGPSANQNR